MDEDQLPFNEVIAIKKIDENQFQSLHPPIAIGGSSAYGGSLVAVGLNAAFQTLSKDSKHKPYSLQGNYLGPTSIDEVVNLRVTTLRQTRTFSTRLVILSQIVDSDDDEEEGVESKPKSRDCLSMVVDFILTGNQSLISYSIPTYEKSITHHSNLKNTLEALDERVKNGQVKEGMRDMWQFGFAPMLEIFVQKNAPESILGQNMMGMLHNAKTDQDSREIQEKVGYDWFKVRLPISSSKTDSALPLIPHSEASIFLAFALDGALTYLPLAFNKISLLSTEVNATSDFSLRFHLDEIDSNSWFIREMKTISAGNERTFNEARVWIENENSKNGKRLVASMSQACVLRGKKSWIDKHGEAKL